MFRRCLTLLRYASSVSQSNNNKNLLPRLNLTTNFTRSATTQPKSKFHLGEIRRMDTLSQSLINQEVTVAGWVKSTRLQGENMLFMEVSDGSSSKNLQIVVFPTASEWESIKKIKTACSLRAKGILVKSQGKNQKYQLKISDPEHSIKVLGACTNDKYPLAAKYHKPETLRETAHLRPRTTLISTIARVKNSLAYATHQFFQENGFLYVHTPIITTSDCEGAGQMFQVTTLMPLSGKIKDIPQTKSHQKSPTGQKIVQQVIDYSQDFFKKPSGLTVSGQLAAEAYACSLMNVYTFGPTFRAENSHTTRHAAEFWMVEPEMAFADIHDAMDCAEAYLKYVCEYVLLNNNQDIDWLQSKQNKNLVTSLRQIVASNVKRIQYTEAIKILEDSINKKLVTFENNDVKWGDDLASEHEKYICELVKGPVIVYNYPAPIKAFYMRLNDDGKTVASFDILVPGVGEIVGGSQREERLELLQQKMKGAGLSEQKYSWYLDLRRYGTVPHAGFGLGFERLGMMVTGCDNIRELLAFPRTTGNASY